MRSYMKYNTVIYGFYRAKKGIDFGKSLFVLEGIIRFVYSLALHRRGDSYKYAKRMIYNRKAVQKNSLFLL